MNTKDRRWLRNIIDTAKLCLHDKKPSEEWEKLMFQLEAKSKEENA